MKTTIGSVLILVMYISIVSIAGIILWDMWIGFDINFDPFKTMMTLLITGLFAGFIGGVLIEADAK